MNFIYGIMYHQLTNPLVYLVNELIKSPNSKILIHVDKKSDLDHIKKSLPSSSQIEFLKERVDVHWGGYTQIEATLKLLNYASQFEYQYFYFLSSDDIPLMPTESIEKYLLSSDQEYIGYELQADPRNRIKYLYPDFFFIKEICKVPPLQILTMKTMQTLNNNCNRFYFYLICFLIIMSH